MGSESMLQEILWDTKIGWWKVDMARRVLLLSDYLCKTIGTEESEIGYDRRAVPGFAQKPDVHGCEPVLRRADFFAVWSPG